jgi:hypothetical protein
LVGESQLLEQLPKKQPQGNRGLHIGSLRRGLWHPLVLLGLWKHCWRVPEAPQDSVRL